MPPWCWRFVNELKCVWRVGQVYKFPFIATLGGCARRTHLNGQHAQQDSGVLHGAEITRMCTLGICPNQYLLEIIDETCQLFEA